MIGTDRQAKAYWLRGALVLATLTIAEGALANGDPAALCAAALDTLANIILVEKEVDEPLRDEAVALLGKYGGPAHTAVLLQRLESTPSNAGKVAAVRALGELGDKTVIPTLHGLFVAPETHRTDEDLRHSVAAAAGDALINCGEDGLDVVLEASRGQDAQIRRRAVQALARADDLAIPGLFVKFAGDRDRWVRLETAAILGTLGDASVVPTLQKLLDDTEADIRLEAAKSLARLGDASGVKLLVRLMRSKTDRALALRLLARLDPPEHLPALFTNLKKPVSEAELDDIAALLSACEPDDVALPLMDACGDESARLRANAAALLGRLKERDATEALIKLLRDPPWDVRAEAARALGLIGAKNALPPLKMLAEQLQRRGMDARTTATREACAIALVRLGDRDSAAPLCLVVFGERKRINARPEVVALVGGKEIERVLIESIRHPDPGQPVERLLGELRALELIGAKAAAPALEELLRERPYAEMHALDLPEVWAALLDALGGCAGPAAAKTAANYAGNETPIVRCAACRAILQLTTEETTGD